MLVGNPRYSRMGLGTASVNDVLLNPVSSFSDAATVLSNLWCDLGIGTWIAPGSCAIPNASQIQNQQIQELSTTSMTPINQAAAVQAGDVSVANDIAQQTAAYQPISDLSSWLLIGLIAFGVYKVVG